MKLTYKFIFRNLEINARNSLLYETTYNGKQSIANKKCEILSTYDKNVQSEIWSFFYDLFLCYLF